MPTDGSNPRRGTIAYEILHRLSDNQCNNYPTESEAIITCSTSGNSNGELTVEILNRVIFPAIGIHDAYVEVF